MNPVDEQLADFGHILKNLDMKMPEIVDKKYEKRKIHEEKITSEKLDKLERQKQVYILDLQGYTHKEKAQILNVSESTIDKDIAEIKQDAKAWFKEVSKSGLAKSLVDSVFQLDLVSKELWIMYRNSKDDKLKILSEIANTSVKKKDLFWASDQKPSWFELGV